MVHLSTNKNNYKKYKFKPHEIEQMRGEPNELYKVLYYHDAGEKERREESAKEQQQQRSKDRVEREKARTKGRSDTKS